MRMMEILGGENLLIVVASAKRNKVVSH